MLVHLDNGSRWNRAHPAPDFGHSPHLKSVGALPFKTIVLSFKSRLAFYRLFFGVGVK